MDERQPRLEGAGDPATRLLVEVFCVDLRRLARRERRRVSSSATLNTTALVHEAYVKLYQVGHWQDHAHFLK